MIPTFATILPTISNILEIITDLPRDIDKLTFIVDVNFMGHTNGNFANTTPYIRRLNITVIRVMDTAPLLSEKPRIPVLHYIAVRILVMKN